MGVDAHPGSETKRERSGPGRRVLGFARQPPRSRYTAIRVGQGIVDLCVLLAATLAAYLLMAAVAVPGNGWPTAATVVLALSALMTAALVASGVHRAVWTKVSFYDVRRLAIAIASVSLVATVGVALLQRAPWLAGSGSPLTPPWSSPAWLAFPWLAGAFALLGMLCARGVARQIYEMKARRDAPHVGIRHVLLAGAGEAGTLLARAMERHPETRRRAIGFLDDDPSKAGRSVAGVPVLGRIEDLPTVLKHERVDEVIITLRSADGRAVRRIVEAVRLSDPSVSYRIIPPLHELVSGKATIDRVREVAIDDLLRRPPVVLDADRIRGHLQGKRVMITGAGGSIGSELVRQICRFAPEELLLFGHGENSIYQLERELDRSWPDVRYRSMIGAVQNAVRLESVLHRYRPEIIFHTAAHKHVPLMELNPEEAVFNNVVGSRNLVRLALQTGVTHLVNVSTDKAVAPSSVMGASKRIVEMLVEDAARESRPGQVFVSVRFGNVLGSRGSVVPIFEHQIRSGGPVTVTHPDMVRYFMTIPEASQLVLQAAATGNNGDVYILDMGEPVRVVDLARDLIRLSGLEPDVDVAIEFTGSRPGEKLREELVDDGEPRMPTHHDKIFVTHPEPLSADVLDELVDDLTDAALRADDDEIRRLFDERIPGAHLIDAPRSSIARVEPQLR